MEEPLEAWLETDADELTNIQLDFEGLHVECRRTDSTDVSGYTCDEVPRREKIEGLLLKDKIEGVLLGDTTLLFIDVQGFTAACALMDAQRAGEWVQLFYDQVELQCHAHCVVLVEHRGDCCVCADRRGNQVAEILSLAAGLHRALTPTHTVRMGVSTGPVCFLHGSHFFCVFGSVSEKADRLQAVAVPGMVLVGVSALRSWARATGNPAPVTHVIRTRSNLHEYETAEFVVERAMFRFDPFA